MTDLASTTPETRLDSFHVYRIPYKKIGEHAIEVGILVPKELEKGKHPVMVKWHGGGLITGDALYPDWIAAFKVPFLHRTRAIALLPNYRLLPEHTGADILQDMADFWSWFHAGEAEAFLGNLQQHTGISLDHDKVLVAGDSAGGYMALMSGLLQPKGSIKTILAQYPMTNYLRAKADRAFFGGAEPPKETVLFEHLKAMKPGEVVSSVVPPARLGLSYVMAVYGHYLKYFGSEDEKMWPVGLVSEKKWLPPTWILHGGADSAVSVEDSKLFVKKCEGLDGVEVKLTVREGMEHGFDGAAKEEEEAWLKEGLKWVEEKWLS
ncbi:Alpha beta hydrolase fold-3 [Pyrenophora seminiperda CCB06]|uniref:Alpha beta hydrolase fold-3 n=1 Tax=Pyrenophora seminiperda CCB06 TaxID=1302712 RepID=A0A3M7M660_9PLEO|nr:Alpha beta hydrolase fold-3 [Pyrenophora seminiperda CCB06]